VILQSELGYSTTGGPKPALYILLINLHVIYLSIGE